MINMYDDSVDTQLYPNTTSLIYRGLWQYMPNALLMLTKYTPGHNFSRFRRLNAEFERVAKPLFHSNTTLGLASREAKKDVMSMLSEFRCHTTHLLHVANCVCTFISQGQRVGRSPHALG